GAAAGSGWVLVDRGQPHLPTRVAYMNLDPTMLEALATAVLTLLGVRAGYGVAPRSAGGEGEGSAESRAAGGPGAMVGEWSVRVDRAVGEMERLEEQARQQGRAHARLGADFDAVADALDVLVTHIGGQLPEQARRSVGDKLERRQRHEVTDRRPS